MPQIAVRCSNKVKDNIVTASPRHFDAIKLSIHRMASKVFRQRGARTKDYE